MAKDAKTKTAGKASAEKTPKDAGPAEKTGQERAARGGKPPPKDRLQLGLEAEDIRLAKSRAAADAASARHYRFWRGVCIVALVAVAVVVWAYLNASYLGLPVERWQRAIEAEIQRIVSGGGELASGHAAGADAPMVDTPDEPAASPQAAGSGGLSAAEAEELERLLAELDFATGPVDGVIDAETQKAIRDYQAIAGLAETGEPSKALLSDLREVSSLMQRDADATD
jgi:hypothetical protein